MSGLQEWHFGWSWPVLLGALAGLALCLRLCYVTWVRSGKRRLVAFLEVIRFATVALLLFTLANPERVERVEREDKPEVHLFADASGSMSTRDVADANGSLRSRADWVAETLAAPWRKKLEEDLVVTERPFSSEAAPGSTDLSEPLRNALDDSPNLKAALYLTDGDWNMGPSPLSLAGRSKGAGVPIYVVRVGKDKDSPDLSLKELTAPSFALKGESITLSYRVENAYDRLTRTTLKLFANGKPVAINADGANPLQRTLEIQPNDDLKGYISWKPDKNLDGNITLRAEIDALPDEAVLDNNLRATHLRIENKVLRVLIVDSFPRWEYRFLRNALDRDPGVLMNCLLLHPGMGAGGGRGYLSEFPATAEELTPFDVVFLGDVGIGDEELSEENAEQLLDLVRLQAAGVVFLPGRRGRQYTISESPLAELLPITYDPDKPTGMGTSNPSSLILTSKGRKHWLTTLRGSGETDVRFWERLPGFHWSAAALKSRPGSEVLAVHSNFRNEWGRMPTLAIRYVGAGKSLYLGSDSAWRWRRGVEDKYHYRFWSQIVRWMARKRHVSESEGIKILQYPERPKLREEVRLSCIVLDKEGLQLEGGTVEAVAYHPGGETERIEFEPDPSGPGVYLASFRTRRTGTVTLDVRAPDTGRSIISKIIVERPDVEEVGKAAKDRPLPTLAELTGGKFVHAEDFDEIATAIAALPDPAPLERIHRLRADLAWGIILCVLLAIYWTGRKFAGMI